MKKGHHLVFLLVILVTAGCGGSSGGSSQGGNSGGGDGSGGSGGGGTTNSSPTVDAGNAISLFEYTDGELIGSAQDSDGTIQSYSWSQTAGASATLGATDESTLKFVAPDVAASTVLEFTLTAADDDGATTSDIVTVTVEPLQEVSGVLSADTVLDGNYAVLDDLQVAQNVTLQIVPGSTLRFGVAAELVVAGTLLANGTAAAPIFFSYLRLDANPNSSWDGIQYEGSVNSSLTYSVIEGASAAVDLDGLTELAISHNVFRANQVGITDSGGYQVVNVSRNTFVENLEAIAGIRTLGSSSFSGNLFIDNPSAFASGFYFDSTTISGNGFQGSDLVVRGPENGFGYGTVTATDNWWNTTDTTQIDAMIIDLNDDVTLQEVQYVPYLTTMPTDVGSEIAGDVQISQP